MDKIVELLSGKIVDWLVNNNKIGPEKEELYKYSALITIQSSMNILATLFLGFIFGTFFENICFFTAFKVLRKYSGGLHSSKFSKCFMISVIANIAVLLAMKFLEAYPNYYLVIAFAIVSFSVVIVFAPVANLNKPITEKEYRIYKLIVSGVSLVLSIIAYLLFLCESIFAFAISLAMLLNSLLVVIELIKRRCSN